MDKTFVIAQQIIAAVMFLCVIVGVVGHIVLGHITSIFGYLMAFIFLALMWKLLRLSWKEYVEVKNK